MNIKYILIILFVFQFTILKSQKQIIGNIKIDGTLIKTGEFEGYFRYDLGKFIFLNGRFENNLKIKILNKYNNKILFVRNLEDSDAMILKPEFYINNDLKIILIFVELAAEYSWGQELILIKNNKINYLGYLDYAVDINEGLSIADFCHVEYQNDNIFLNFDDVPIIYWKNESLKIQGKDLKFEIKDNKILKKTNRFILNPLFVN